ncbi:MAG: hypothetical protein P4M02_08205 [Clostridia bacterium]|nr:hypothetical protein [Clostridia bacterium]
MSEENKASNTSRPNAAGRPRGAFGGRGGGPGGALGRPVEKAKDFKGTLKRLLAYLKPQRVNLTIVVIFAIVSTTFTVMGPKISGNAMNQLTDGFIAKSIVSGIGGAQPDLKSTLKKYTDAISSAKKAADAAVEKGLTQALNTQKQKAYAQAAQKVDAIVTQKFNEAINTKKQQAYALATQKADAIVTQKFNEAISAKKQLAYTSAQTQAEAAAKAAVDQQFAALLPGVPRSSYGSIPQYVEALKQAYVKADAMAKAGVDAAFAKQQPTMNAQLAAAKTQAEAKAKAAVNAAFIKQQPTMNAQLAAAKSQAQAKAKAAVDTAFAKQ